MAKTDTLYQKGLFLDIHYVISTLPTIIRQVRKERGQTLEYASLLIGLGSRQRLSQYEQGIRFPTNKSLLKILDWLADG